MQSKITFHISAFQVCFPVVPVRYKQAQQCTCNRSYNSHCALCFLTLQAVLAGRAGWTARGVRPPGKRCFLICRLFFLKRWEFRRPAECQSELDTYLDLMKFQRDEAMFFEQKRLRINLYQFPEWFFPAIARSDRTGFAESCAILLRNACCPGRTPQFSGEWQALSP